ncbi:hypothetical protein HKCCE2091_12865, partial [Rhodobacterales bacterium HKCCE2091]|nr:hypothetical protein [Rhodobacterales bacterium HKCCE2091]
EAAAADRAIEAAEAGAVAPPPIEGPPQCDWSLRADLWSGPVRPRGAAGFASPRRISDAITVFHDDPAPEIAIRQVRTAPGRYAVTLEVFGFGGSFVSLVQDLPETALSGLSRQHFFRVALRLASDRPPAIYARLNLQHGPNMEQLLREMPVSGGQALAEFDLAYTTINEKRMEKIWLDLIFENPAMTRVEIADMTIARAPRADI